MSDSADVAHEIKELVRRHFEAERAPFVEGETPLPLNVPSFGWEEVWEAVDSLLTNRLTMGEKVRRFEETFASYIGARHAVMVNSGSSANLLALSVLTNPLAERPIAPRDEVITPAVTWATTPRTRAIMPVHLLGNPCDMPRLMEIARRHGLLVIEDTCEAHGAMLGDRKAGSFGDISTFSFFFTHHVNTVEGGMLVTDDHPLADLARALRAFGWVRDQSDPEEAAARHPEIDPRFLFVNIGYNFKPTELQAAFGIHQMDKLEGFIKARRVNAREWTEALLPYGGHVRVHEEREGTRHVWFGYQVTVQPGTPLERSDLVAHLEAKGLETRPIVAGNIAEQPALRLFPHRQAGDLPNSRLIMRRSFYFGNHQGIGAAERLAVKRYLLEFLDRYRDATPAPVEAREAGADDVGGVNR